MDPLVGLSHVPMMVERSPWTPLVLLITEFIPFMRSSVVLLQLMAIHHASTTQPNPTQPMPEGLQQPGSTPKDMQETEVSDAASMHSIKPLIPSTSELSGSQNSELSEYRNIVVSAFEGLSKDKRISPKKFNENINVEVKSHKLRSKYNEDKELLGVYNLMKRLDDMKLFQKLSEKVNVQDNTRFVKSMAAIAQQNGFSFTWFPFSEIASRLIKELKDVSINVDDLHKTLKDISTLCEEKCQEIKDTSEADDGFIGSLVGSEFLKSKLPTILKALEAQGKKCYDDLEKKNDVQKKESRLYIVDCCFQTIRSMVGSIIDIQSYRVRKYEQQLFGRSVGIWSRPHSMQKKMSEVAIGVFMLIVGRNKEYYMDLKHRSEKGWFSKNISFTKSNLMNDIKITSEKVKQFEMNPSATDVDGLKNEIEALEQQIKSAQSDLQHDDPGSDLDERLKEINELKSRVQLIEAGGKKDSTQQPMVVLASDPEEKMSTLMIVFMSILFVSFLGLAAYTLVKASKI